MSPTAPTPTETPLQALARELTSHYVERSKRSTAIRDATKASIKKRDRLADRDVHALEAVALDVWHGRDFARRNRSRAWSWVPFYDGELDPTPDTPDTTAARLRRTYTLSGDEQKDHAAMVADPIGQFAVTAAVLAARINAYPVWRHDFFDEHSVRIDLANEVSVFTDRARRLRHTQKVLGPQPTGDLRHDTKVVDTYISKATAIDRGIGALMERLEALDSYCDVVASIQRRKNKYDYLARLNGIDDLELLVDDDLDRRESERVRDAGSLSDALAVVYLDTRAPLTKTLAGTD
ncbi:hypothetical protein ASG12_07690 [Williamsia sp. Leaf354]|uniref:hypothetical protein n=1 Tax=Williamsia sp. Leaf354 TaxID=1736349 RepID=UPI0006F7E821|nr:hypothetical protein [Williamsia sp. Leaf354]KQS00735.1 hypothetical protein ASG12_07690 [Williamsia sp. Leaf354]